MLNLILGILGILPKALDTVNTLTNAIRDEKITQINAKTDQDRIASQERQVQLEARRDVLIAEAANPRTSYLNACTRLLLASGAILTVLKLTAWDKVYGSLHGCTNTVEILRPDNCYMFRTDPLGPDMWGLIGIMVGFYFLARDK